ncbi:hypothetical protein KSP40_PGU001476 [Platanthera guangdongensis]|uniref:Uncharacterized protein n=1 Tax=Platanthera guangdongensis TaxID=2320717 RepID=A0ABR2M639_9ASPA
MMLCISYSQSWLTAISISFRLLVSFLFCNYNFVLDEIFSFSKRNREGGYTRLL